MANQVTEVDGSVLEGGGQILRIALTMSAIRQRPIRIFKIRAGRSKPGLVEQHLKGVELLRDICNAQVEGDELGSTEVKFWPQQMIGGSYEAHVRTAGSISLLLQVALPCVLFCQYDSVLRLYGGTNAEMAPQIDYTTEVFRPNLEKFGATFDFDMIKRGYYPKGGGEVVIKVKPVRMLNPVTLLDRGNIIALYGWSFVAGSLQMDVAHSMANSAAYCLRHKFRGINIERYKENRNMAHLNGAGIILVAKTDTDCYLGGSALQRRKETPADTGKRAALELAKSIDEGACVDDHCQDQLIIFMALASGVSKIRVGKITQHTETAIHVAQQFTDARFDIIDDGPCKIIQCNPSP